MLSTASNRRHRLWRLSPKTSALPPLESCRDPLLSPLGPLRPRVDDEHPQQPDIGLPVARCSGGSLHQAEVCNELGQGDGLTHPVDPFLGHAGVTKYRPMKNASHATTQ